MINNSNPCSNVRLNNFRINCISFFNEYPEFFETTPFNKTLESSINNVKNLVYSYYWKRDEELEILDNSDGVNFEQYLLYALHGYLHWLNSRDFMQDFETLKEFNNWVDSFPLREQQHFLSFKIINVEIADKINALFYFYIEGDTIEFHSAKCVSNLNVKINQ